MFSNIITKKEKLSNVSNTYPENNDKKITVLLRTQIVFLQNTKVFASIYFQLFIVTNRFHVSSYVSNDQALHVKIKVKTFLLRLIVKCT